MRDEPEDILISDEEKTVAVFLILAVAIGVIALATSVTLLLWALATSGDPAEPGRLQVAVPIVLLIWGAILFAVFGRWPGSVTSESAIDLAVPPEAVWDAIALRSDYPGWKKIYTGIEQLNEKGEIYRLHYAEDSHCRRCRLPRDPDRSRWSTRVEVLEADFPYFYETAVFPKIVIGDPEADSPLQAEHYAMALQPIEGGGTRITNMSTAYRPKLWFAFVCWLGWPMKEELRSLKAHLDRTPDNTLYGIAAQRMANARAAKAWCSCQDARA